MLALSVVVLVVQHEGKSEVNYGLRVVYKERHCDWLDAVQPVRSDIYLAAPMLDAVQPVRSDIYLAAPMLDAVPPVRSDSYLAADSR